VHCYCTTGFLVTLRRAPSPALDALRQAGSVQPQLASDPIRALHPLVSSLYTSLASKHLAVVSRRLAAVATIFLPISAHRQDRKGVASVSGARHGNKRGLRGGDRLRAQPSRMELTPRN